MLLRAAPFCAAAVACGLWLPGGDRPAPERSAPAIGETKHRHLVGGGEWIDSDRRGRRAARTAGAPDEDWIKITGPHGVAFIAVCAVVVLWFNKLTGEKSRSKELAAQMEREDERREAEERNKEKRHEENLAASREYAEGMKALAVESMKTTIVVNHTLKDLIKELKNRPCNIGLQASQLIKDSGEDLTEKADPE